jgi:hypothetical protein
LALDLAACAVHRPYRFEVVGFAVFPVVRHRLPYVYGISYTILYHTYAYVVKRFPKKFANFFAKHLRRQHTAEYAYKVAF